MANGSADSYTIWERLDPVSRSRELTGTLRMELADPLWMLARQWQFGEFEGEDAGSPIAASVEYFQDLTSRIQIGPGSEPEPYDAIADPPLETLIERERVASEAPGGPSLRLRTEAGMNFLDRLRRELTAAGASGTDHPVPSDFPAAFWPVSPEVSNETGRRYYDVVGPAPQGDAPARPRGLDGHAVYDSLLVVPGITDPEAAKDWASVDPDDLPRPRGEFADLSAADSEPFRNAAEEFVLWYRGLYREPREDNDAWDPARMEYNARISAGATEDETVFQAAEYEGGRLDWYDFSPDPGRTLHPESDPAAKLERHDLPTRMRFRGMPAPRLWEMENSGVNLSALSAAGDDLSRLFLLEYALLSGDDWFILPIEAPVGSVTRVSHLEITDAFNRTTLVGPTRGRADAAGWSMYTFNLPAHATPGLFLPPVLGSSLTTDAVERVVFARDEMANLLFGVEATFEGPLGDPIDRDQFARPRLAVTEISPSSDPDSEYVEVSNQGDDHFDLDGYAVVVESSDSPIVLHLFDDRVLESRASVRIYTGGDRALDTFGKVHAEMNAPQLADGVVVSVYEHWQGPDDPGNRVLIRRPVKPRESSGLDHYRIASDVPDHFFPFSLPVSPSGGRAHEFRLALLLDASAMTASPEALPRPLGAILDPLARVPAEGEPVRIPEEEITRGGLEVVRKYQLAAWIDGSSHLWSGREVRPGTGEMSSGLRFDYLDPPESTLSET